MLNRILNWSIAQRWTVIVAAFVISLWGILNLANMPLDVFPPFAPPQVDIQTEAPGFAPEDIEAQITLPIEQRVNGISGVDVVRSSSKVGLSTVEIVFDPRVNIRQARQSVNERLQQVPMPDGVEPKVSPLTAPLGTIVQYAFTTEDNSLAGIREVVDGRVRDRLLAIPGVADVTVLGGDQPQVHVLVQPEKLNAFNLDLADITAAVQNTSVAGTGGFLQQGGQEFVVRGLAELQSLDELKQTVVAGGDRPILLGEVADIVLGSAPKRGDAHFNGMPAVVVTVRKHPQVDTPTVTTAVEEAIASLQSSLPDTIQITRTFRQANFIEAAVRNVSGSLLQGMVIVAVVLMLFLMNWRTAVITLSAIPLSLLIGLSILHTCGLGINTMTLGGLVVAIGSVVDDSIVDMEQCYRGLRSNQAKNKPIPPLKVVFNTSVQVRRAVFFSTVIIVVVFAPIFSLTGVEGRIFAPMGLAYIVSICASTLVALTLSPALCAILLANQSLPPQDAFLSRWAKRIYRPLLDVAVRSPSVILALALTGLIGAIALVPTLGRTFLPEFQEKALVNSMVLLPGVSLDATNAAGDAFYASVKDDPLFEWVQIRTGRAPGDTDGAGVNVAHVDMELSDRALQNRADSLRLLRDRFTRLKGVVPSVGGFISHRMDEVLSGVRSAIAIKIFGPDLDTLWTLGEQVRDAIRPIPGVVDLQVEPQVPIRQIHIRFDRTAAANYGVSISTLSEVVDTALKGRVVGSAPSMLPNEAEASTLLPLTKERGGVRTIDIVVGLDESERDSLEALQALPIRTPQQGVITLGAVARIEEAMGPNLINRENVARRIVVSANVAEQDLGSVVSGIQSRIQSEVDLPTGYRIEYGGQFESEQRATRNLVGFSAIAILIIAVVMYAAVKSLPATLAILINLPLALAGGIAAVLLSGGVLSVASLVGFITLFGVAVRNGLLLVETYNAKRFALKDSHPTNQTNALSKKNIRVLVTTGSLERMNAILMTALTSALGMLPLAIASGAGNEILQPLATVVLGGLMTSTLLTLLVIPALYAKWGNYFLARNRPKSVSEAHKSHP